MERREDRARAQASVRERAGEEKPASEKNVSAQKKQSALRGVGYVAVVAVFTALLLAAQYALWFVKGVEAVTVLLLVFSYRFGVRCGVLSAVAFSLLRCLLFGFFPNVVLLYLIYYPLFAACFGGVGNALRRRADLKTQLLLTALAVLFTALFTLLDDAVTPLFYGYTKEAALAYFLASLPTMTMQCACALLTVFLLFRPLMAVLRRVRL
mgnify:FL=1